jgi:hypothetical protein
MDALKDFLILRTKLVTEKEMLYVKRKQDIFKVNVVCIPNNFCQPGTFEN